ncbi:Hypothetical protein AJAP_20685 [Amycolatopsis japonica]|uniref:Uncharacterized protein n=1 Tax=Amycolatopsis japonica TaxID=208439 RepID=A0A075US24_9PSEU|nr:MULTISPECIES: hypothetical protein [Amycolatopsis]AIG76997.1 Hypothetical protein AJAP_20685 [Amycolatopsis japonica]OKK00606.1 hypothetical protein AMK34_02950 [Amycolatopsis sp. CB00013]
MPRSKLAPFGIWEHGEFVGVIIFGRSAAAARAAVALRQHEHPVTQILAASLRQLRAACPGLRLIVSYADTAQGHHGGLSGR